MTKYEYLELDIHGYTAAREEPDLGEGRKGYIATLNSYGEKGWRVIWIDRDTTSHIIAVLEREIADG